MTLLTIGLNQARCLLYSGSKILRPLTEPVQLVQARNYAARKGYREKREKAKVKKEVEKKVFIPHNIRKRELLLQSRKSRKVDDSWKRLPIDNVYVQKYYQKKVYPFTEAVLCHRETHHPDIYNQPNAKLNVTVELNMQGEKQTRFVDNFHRIVAIPHMFDHGEERTIIAFTKEPEQQKEATKAGAQLAGGVELIKNIQNGDISLNDFHHVIAHPNILPELAPLRGLMKRKFPSPNHGTLCVDMAATTLKFLNGISYSALKDEFEKDFGIVETVIGTLDMNEKHLEDNFAALIRDIYEMRPKKATQAFIRRCLLTSPPSQEVLTVGYKMYVNQDEKVPEVKDADEDEPVAASN